MPEGIKDFLLAVGGGSVVLVGILTIFKNIFIKLVDTGLETSFSKSLEKYRNKLMRTTKAYEILLDREMQFYKNIEPIFAELIPLVQDMSYYLEQCQGEERKSNCEKFKECFERYMEIILSLKNETLLHQSYIPNEVFISSTEIVKSMQDDLDIWCDMAKFAFENECNKIDYVQIKGKVNMLLQLIARAELFIKKRLRELSGE